MGIQMYIYAAILAVGIAMGGTVAYKIEHGNVLKLELAISQANVKAETTLQIAKDNVAKAEKETRQANQELDKANEQSIQTINSYHDQLASALQLRDPNYASNPNTLSGTPDTTVNPENGKTEGIISNDLARLLQSETARADKITVDYNTLLEFVQDNNCGIVK